MATQQFVVFVCFHNPSDIHYNVSFFDKPHNWCLDRVLRKGHGN